MNSNTPTSEQLTTLFGAIVEQSVDGVLLIDAGGVIQFANAAARSLLAGKTDQPIGFHLGYPAIAEPVDLVVPAGDESRIVEMRAREIPWHGATAALANLRDVTERTRTQEALARQQELLKIIVDNMLDMVALTDAHGRFTYVSPSVRQLGYRPAQLLGRSVLELVHEDDQTLARSEIAAALQAPATRKVEYRHRCADGSFRWLESVGKMLVDSKGEPTGLIVSTRDVTERKSMAAQLAQADRLSGMGMLAAGVAHEINNPLAYILYNLESLSEDLPELFDGLRQFQARLRDRFGDARVDELTADLAEAMSPAALDDIVARAKDALGGSHRIRNIAKGLGTFSRVEKDRLVPVNLRDVIDIAINMAFNEIKYRARVVKDFGKTATVLASEGRLAQVFLNLIINATHAMEEGDVANNELRFRTWTEGETVCAEVSDTGSGIAPDNLAKIFDPFFTTKKVGVGSGLGLPISKSIIESYEGRLQVHSELGKGTRFTIRLPVCRSTDVLPSETNTAAAPPRVRGRILIVDDDDGVRAALQRMLKAHDTVGAADGADAKRLLQQDPKFDVVLCDMMMSKVSGMELHAWLNATHPSLAKQLIFVTGGTFTPRARDYLAKVDNIRLEKPLDAANVRKIVGEIIRNVKNAG